ncbi:hypothetical protein KP509_34G064100 [Ceratopteris richardii]|uniref:Glycosyltransferase n=2 Tax=Ceratopteris richardii TaxID=49495 RepID=A0A8T2QMK7_CERRI|nr:hypothetical protein KP509_34G064100 [Ceratopteris richardii]
MANDKQRYIIRRSRPHVLAVSFAGLSGHLNPLTSLCLKLAEEGVAITVAYPHSYFERLTPAKINVYASAGIRVVGVRDGLAYQEYLSIDTPRQQCEASINMEEGLVELARTTAAESDRPITCIICDVFVPSAASVCERLGIPEVAFWTQSAVSFAVHLFAIENYASLKDSESAITKIPGCPALSLRELPTFLQSLDPSEYYFAYLKKCFDIAIRCPRILLNTFQELEGATLKSINKNENVYAVGPLLPEQGRSFIDLHSATDECLRWLDNQKPRSVLYISFGSIALVSEAQFAEIAAALESSECAFLMVVRAAMIEGGEEARFPVGFRERVNDSGRGFFVEWAPQFQVLSHGSIGGFFTHCGWNSILEGIRTGVPFLCWPYFADQLQNCRCLVEAWGIGLEFKDDSGRPLPPMGAHFITRHAIKEKIQELMDPSSSSSLRERCKQQRIGAVKALLEEDGSSYASLKSFVSWLYDAPVSKPICLNGDYGSEKEIHEATVGKQTVLNEDGYQKGIHDALARNQSALEEENGFEKKVNDALIRKQIVLNEQNGFENKVHDAVVREQTELNEEDGSEKEIPDASVPKQVALKEEDGCNASTQKPISLINEDYSTSF